MDYIGTDVDAELADNENANSVSNDCERNDKKDQERFWPQIPQKQIPCNEAGDEQDQAGVDSAAFRCDFE